MKHTTDPTEDCPRCSVAAVCTKHKEYATKDRPTAAAFLAIVRAGRWRGSGTGTGTAEYGTREA